MIIEQNKVVSLIYELRASGSNGEIVESLTETNPLKFLFGTGSLLPKFESNISGLKVGDSFNFELKCNDAYGTTINEAIVDIPKNVFLVEGQLDNELIQVGNSVPMMDSEGNRLNGIVVSIEDESVKMDFNHPLAGEDLFFKGKIVDIREATQDELTHGHIHSSNSCSGCDSQNDSNSEGGCCGSCS